MKINNRNYDKSFYKNMDYKSKTQTKPWSRSAKQKSKILKSVLNYSIQVVLKHKLLMKQKLKIYLIIKQKNIMKF